MRGLFDIDIDIDIEKNIQNTFSDLSHQIPSDTNINALCWQRLSLPERILTEDRKQIQQHFQKHLKRKNSALFLTPIYHPMMMMERRSSNTTKF